VDLLDPETCCCLQGEVEGLMVLRDLNCWGGRCLGVVLVVFSMFEDVSMD